MENQKNLFLAIVISMAIIFGFQLLVPQPEKTPIAEEQTFEENSVELSIQNTDTQIVVNRDEVISSSGRVVFDNGKIKGSINLEGGFIDDLVLEEFRETLDSKSDLIEFLNPLGSQDAYYLDTGWVSSDSTLELPDNKSIWKTNKTSISADDSVKLFFVVV